MAEMKANELVMDPTKEPFITLQNRLSFSKMLQLIDRKELYVGMFREKTANSNDNSNGNAIFAFLSLMTTSNDSSMKRDQLCSYTIFPSKTINLEIRFQWIDQLTKFAMSINRAVGSMVGMGIGDAIGHPLEFIPVTDIKNSKKDIPRFSYKEKKYYNEFNKFRLQPGQWTDDAAMGLCQADSLIIHEKYDGSDIRIRFWNWWNNGYNNAFRKDKTRSSSVGLGGNISSSIYSCDYNKVPTERFEVKHEREDSGNGSLMRLAPIPIFFHKDINKAMKYSFESSFTTHPGYIAAEACSLLGYIIVSAIHAPDNIQITKNVKKFMNDITDKYKQKLLQEISNLEIERKEVETKLGMNDNKKEKNENDEDGDIVMDNNNDDDNNNNNNNNNNININNNNNEQKENVKNENIANDKKDKNAKNAKNKNKINIAQKKKEFLRKKPWRLINRKINAKQLIIRLITSKEPKNSLERCWNWKNKYGNLGIIETYYNRIGGKNSTTSKKYNGYPVNPGYWGSYCMDGLAMGLHCVYNSNNFADAVEKCVNLLGDADSTGSIGGQIAGAIYGYQSISCDEQQRFLLQWLNKWDDKEFALRGLILYILGDPALKNQLMQ